MLYYTVSIASGYCPFEYDTIFLFQRRKIYINLRYLKNIIYVKIEGELETPFQL